jgi:DNA-binding PadR family transcriptional regulator
MHHCHPRWGSWLMSGPGWRRSRGESAYGGPFGRHRGGPFGGRRGSRMFDQGALRLVVLGLIAEEPRHGYDIIKALEERFAGTYSPSPGSIYPMLQMLEEADLVSSEMSGNKRLFSITEAGRAYMKDNEADLARINAQIDEASGRAGVISLLGEAKALGRALFERVRDGDLSAEQAEKARAILANARKALDEL